MKRTVRSGVFETNSSSCHAIIIAQDWSDEDGGANYYTDGGRFDRFDVDTLTSTAEKLDYLWQAILDCHEALPEEARDLSTWRKVIQQYLPYATLDVKYDSYGMPSGYIDHGGEYVPMLRQMHEDNTLVARLLLGKDSSIWMSPDEDYREPEYPDCDYILFEN